MHPDRNLSPATFGHLFYLVEQFEEAEAAQKPQKADRGTAGADTNEDICDPDDREVEQIPAIIGASEVATGPATLLAYLEHDLMETSWG